MELRRPRRVQRVFHTPSRAPSLSRALLHASEFMATSASTGGSRTYIKDGQGSAHSPRRSTPPAKRVVAVVHLRARREGEQRELGAVIADDWHFRDERVVFWRRA